MATKTKSRPSKLSSTTADDDNNNVPVSPPSKTSSSSKKKKKKKNRIISNDDKKGVTESSSSSRTKNKETLQEEPKKGENSSSSSGDDHDRKLTLEALDAISDDDDDDYDDNQGEGVAEAAALRKMIQDGKFDSLLRTKNNNDSNNNQPKKKKQIKKNEWDDDDESEEEEKEEGEAEEDLEEVEVDESLDAEVCVEEEEEEEEEEEDDDDAENGQTSKEMTTQAIALAAAIEGADRHLPWTETFAVVPPTPLPFHPVDEETGGKKKRKHNHDSGEGSDDENNQEDEYVDVHDDLKREVAFYDNAMEAVRIARKQCEHAGIPFTRPEDFFAEMIKSDDHMAKIKDRLIFETKKMEAVERRKSNKEQSVMAKERQAHRIAEKAKAKKAHMSAVEDWKKRSEQGRGPLGGRVHDFDDDENQLRGMGVTGGSGPNKRRMAANKRYGFGGKRGRFKQNDAKTLNDMSGFNPRGSFAGGQKTTATFGNGKKKGGGRGGAKRPGKRARDASKGRR